MRGAYFGNSDIPLHGRTNIAVTLPDNMKAYYVCLRARKGDEGVIPGSLVREPTFTSVQSEEIASATNQVDGITPGWQTKTLGRNLEYPKGAFEPERYLSPLERMTRAQETHTKKVVTK